MFVGVSVGCVVVEGGWWVVMGVSDRFVMVVAGSGLCSVAVHT